ncbi:hypothetical protein QE152_g932 [Popillia japonica]|uniref:Uncharacterized protein n=1 Tax=Popillia japonica TaxID=7064 RepID=A0AAW1NAP3_POPJA
METNHTNRSAFEIGAAIFALDVVSLDAATLQQQHLRRVIRAGNEQVADGIFPIRLQRSDRFSVHVFPPRQLFNSAGTETTNYRRVPIIRRELVKNEKRYFVVDYLRRFSFYDEVNFLLILYRVAAIRFC